MTEAEFRNYIEAFWKWTSKTERPVESWLLSLEEWADDNYIAELRKKQTEKTEKTGVNYE